MPRNAFMDALRDYVPGESMLDALERGAQFIGHATLDDMKTVRTIFDTMIGGIKREREWLDKQRADIETRAARVRALSAAMREMRVTKLTDGDLTIELGPEKSA